LKKSHTQTSDKGAKVLSYICVDNGRLMAAVTKG